MSRRLRVALAYVAPFYASRRIDRVERALKEITSALGRARTLDVNRKILLQEGGKIPTKRQRGLHLLAGALADERAEAVAQLKAALLASRLMWMEHEIRIYLATPLAHASPRALQIIGRREVTALSRKVRKRRNRFVQTGRKKDLHALRIALKKLRYAVEIYAEHHSGEDIAEHVRKWIKVHRRVGALHDLEVLMAWLKRESRRQEGGTDSDPKSRVKTARKLRQAVRERAARERLRAEELIRGLSVGI